MAIEFERRFLVPSLEGLPLGLASIITQGYLFDSDGYCVRVRRRYDPQPDGGYAEMPPTVAVKGPRRDAQRPEYEMEVDIALALQFIRRTNWKLTKARAQLVDQVTWDIDIFRFRLEGLVIAEHESTSPIPEFEPPPWCGHEITHDRRYDNEVLARLQAVPGLRSG